MPDRVADRRGEAHLWLVLEEVVATARAAADARAVTDARRSFRNVADALIAVGAVEPRRADAIVLELDDVLAVRGIVSASAFGGREFPKWSREEAAVRRRGDGWLETEIEHHLDLVVDLEPRENPGLGQRVLDMIQPAVRALQASGSLPHGAARLSDVAATFQAAGFQVEGPFGEPDKGWLAFLRDRPAPLTAALEPVASTVVDVELGSMGGSPVSVRRVAWSEALLEIEVDAPELETTSIIGAAWRCSVFDDAGRLHLGQPGLRRGDESTPLVFRLRPGLMAGVGSMSVRVSRGAERLDERVRL